MQHTAVNLLKTSWAPSNTWNFIHSYIVALDLFYSHYRRPSYLWRYNVSATLAQSYVVQTRQTIVGLTAMARKKIKLEEEAIREILVADTTWELGEEASDF